MNEPGRSVRAVGIAVALSFLVLPLWGLYSSVRPPKYISSITPQDLGLTYEEVSFPTRDGLNLKGWFIPHAQRDRAKTVILLHGYPADKGNVLPPLVFLSRSYNLFLFDFRYLGQSEGNFSTAGAKETEDLLAALRFLKTQGIQEVGIYGFSMGGAVALMVTPQALEIQAVVSESSYARLELMTRELYRIPILRELFGRLIWFWGKLFFGFCSEEVAPAEAARNIRIPVLIIHSRDDQVIPFSHALLLQEALKSNPRAEFWFREEAVHGQLGTRYQRRIGEFFEKHLGGMLVEESNDHRH